MSGEYTTSRVGRSIGLYAAGGLAAGVVGFLALPIFTRIFTPEDFGVIGLFAAGVGLLTPLLMVGGHVFILYDPRRAARPSGAQGAALLLSVFTTLSCLLVGALLWGSGVLSGQVASVAALALLTALFGSLVLLRRQTYQADGRPREYFWLSAVPPVAAFLLTVLFATLVSGWLSRLLALLAVAGATAGWSVWSLRRESRLSLRRGWVRLREVVRFGGPLVVTAAAVWVVGFSDRFIVAKRIGLAEAGIYAVAYSLALGVSSLHEGVSRYFVSRLPAWVESKEGRAEAGRFAHRYAVLALLAMPAFVPIAIVGLRILAAESFAGGASLLYWLIPAQTFAGMARVFAGYLLVESLTATRGMLSAAEAILNVSLTWIMVGSYGVEGAAVATAVTYAASLLVMYSVVRRRGILIEH